MIEQPLTLEEFMELSELFRFYLGLVLQTVTFVLGATGAVVAYVVKEPEKSPYGVYGFAVPAALCFGMGVGFLRAIPAAGELRDRLNVLAESLAFGLAPHSGLLLGALGFFGTLLTVVGLILPVVIWRIRRQQTHPART